MQQAIIIEKLNAKGHGVAYLESGKKVEVVSSLPGDHLIVELTKKRRRGTVTGSIKTIVTPSPLRVAARCRHVPECGGCVWQQMDYPAQLKMKQQQIEELFGCQVLPILPCDSPWNYRNKMEFSFSQNKAGERFLGLVLAGTKGRVFNLKECFLMNTWVAPLLAALRHWWEESQLLAYFMPRDEGSLRTLTLREGKRTGDKMVILTVSGNPSFALTQTQLAKFVRSTQEVLDTRVSIFLRIQQQIKGQPTQFFEMHLAGPDYIEEVLWIKEKQFTFKISPTSFFQPNTLQAEKIYTTALQMIEGPEKKCIYDLYCGTGTLGIVLSSQAERVIGVELNPHAIFDATVNLERNDIRHMELHCGDVAEKLKELSVAPDVIVIDPPRSGLSPQALELILKAHPKEILYVSCHPKTQAADIRQLLQEGYHLAQVQPVDQFPHTIHIENIVLLRR